MEHIKKRIKQKTKIEEISENEIKIVPDTEVNYNFKILLKKKDIDLGFFDAITGNTTQ